MREAPDQHRSPNRMHDRRYFYKYVNAATAKIILSTRKLRWSSPVQFNDPFDVTQELRLNFDESELNLVFAELVASLIEEGDAASVGHPMLAVLLRTLASASPDARRAMASDLRRESSDNPTLEQTAAFGALKQMWREIVPTFRVLCLSELNDVTSMWFHYSDSYRGLVLQFEAIDEVDSNFLVARPVVYQDTPPAIADPQEWARRMVGQAESIYDDLFAEYQYVKTTAWSYEREWRIVSMAGPGETGLFGDYGFHPRELSAVYFGTKCSPEDQADVLGLLSHGLEHVQAWKASPHAQEARFEFREMSR